MLLAIAIVAGLTLYSLKPIDQKNGFERQFINNNVKLLSVAETKNEITAIAGYTNKSVYFQTNSPDKIYATNWTLKKGKYFILNLPTNDMINSRFTCSVDSPTIYLFAGNWPGIFKTDLLSGNTTGYRFPNGLYTRNVIISVNSFVLRAFDSTVKTLDQIFIKGDPSAGVIYRGKIITEVKNDMGISTDGLLHYDSSNHYLAYVLFYTNQFYVLDTTLHLVYTARTIDTLNTFQIKVEGNISKDDVIYTNTSPSRFINMESCVNDGFLYNYSLIQADNETSSTFKKNCDIDVYELKDGSYKGSFYIPSYKKEKIQRFIVFQNSIIALYSKYVCIYSFTH